MKLSLVPPDDPVLRQKAKLVPGITPEFVRLLDDMEETMLASKGIGIAAPQIGESLRLAVVCIGKLPLQVINPEILWRSEETDEGKEGCMSLPGVWVGVRRPHSIRVAFTDRDGQFQEWRLSGRDARVIQHEVDHLDGVLIVDYEDIPTTAEE